MEIRVWGCAGRRTAQRRPAADSRQSSGSSDPSRQSFSPSHFHSAEMQRSSLTPHRNCAVEQLARHDRPSSAITKKSGHAHVYVMPPGASRQRCEQPPLLLPHGFGAARNRARVLHTRVTARWFLLKGYVDKCH